MPVSDAPVIRPARPEEAADVAAAIEWLFAAPGRPAPGWDGSAGAAAIEKAIRDHRSTVLVAHHDGQLAGVCTVYRDIDSVRFGPRAWVEDLAVAPDMRSRGIGRALLDAARDWARDHGASHLALNSAESRVDAHRFYDRERGERSACFRWQL
jgi:GNAT superfamily N-acetyltransferase